MAQASQSTIKALLRFFWSNYRAALITGCLAIIVVDLAELVLPLLLKNIIDSAKGEVLPSLIHSTLFGLAIIIFCQVVCRYLWRISLSRGAMKAGADFREMFSKQIFEIPFSYFEKKKVGDLMTLATSDVENMRLALGPGLISLIDAFFYCIAIPIAMLMLSPTLTLKLLLPVLGIPIMVLLLQKKIAFFSRQVQEQIGRLGTETQEMIAGVRLAKIYGIEERVEKKTK